jgi:hypothetical protein
VALLNRNVVRGYLAADDEIPAAIRWAEIHDLKCGWDEGTLTLTLRLTGSNDAVGTEPYLLVGTFEDYRVLPPTWRFVDPRNGADIGNAAYPQAGPFPNGSVLHPNGVICAPWSRLAYQDRQGPHNDWGDATAWQTTARERTQADRIPDMLARILAEVKLSPGRLAPLPAAPDREAA